MSLLRCADIMHVDSKEHVAMNKNQGASLGLAVPHCSSQRACAQFMEHSTD